MTNILKKNSRWSAVSTQKRPRRYKAGGFLLPTLFLLAPIAARAQQYRVTLDTSGLTPTSIFAVAFNLANGDGGVGSSVTASSFVFGGGAPQGTPTTSGGAGGNLSGSVTLATNASTFSSDFAQNFQRGNQIGFTVDATQMAAKPDPSDRFTFSLTDPSTGGIPVTTNSPGDGFTLFALERSTTGFRTEAYSYTGANGQVYTVQVAAIPESGLLVSFALVSVSGAGLMARRVRRKMT